MSQLERAIILAAQRHADQVDRLGQPYILHPLAVLLSIARDGHPEEMQVAAVLHDVVEDCPDVDLNDIDHYFGARVADIVDALTRRSGESYEDYILRVNQNDSARIVKLADINDHFQPSRRDGLTAKLRDRYAAARDVLFR